MFLRIPRVDGINNSIVATAVTYIEPRGDENVIHFVGGSKMVTLMDLDELEDRIASFVRSPTIPSPKKFRSLSSK